MPWPFIPHRLYNRRADIHAVYGGQQQSGIVTPAAHPGIFVFTGHGAQFIGYSDKWLPDGSIRYTGEGQVGDMAMVRGNAAIRDHAANGKDLLLFETGGKGLPVRFVGQFVCAGWSIEQQLDVNGSMCNAIVFTLEPAEAGADDQVSADGAEDAPVEALSVLRARAMAAAAPSATTGSTTTTVYKRSEAVRKYVLARADGVCEACGSAAPFVTAKGAPYLEPHHIRRLSDGGPDDPRFVAGVCPNCHRRAHHGDDQIAFHAALKAKIASLEGG